ncbi:deaminase [Peptostreptococcus sp. MV1]|uniref:deaminase n=1 Tax=Peptostreptococcus sp. MV1 TaxID=1219626 RepID=UPI000A7FCBBB|nr:deaminase [Peptostreptococcus sp. MV1]
MERNTNLMIVTNRKLCQEGLLKRLEDVFSSYRKGDYLADFSIQGLVLREKDLGEEDYFQLLKDVDVLCKKYQIYLYAHKYWKSALELGIKNIHMPLPLLVDLAENEEDYRYFMESFDHIGASTHSIDEARLAEKLGASYIFAGHVFVTDCKKGLEPRGLDFLGNMCKTSRLPVYAIGGIGMDNSGLALEAGAHGVAIMSGLMKDDKLYFMSEAMKEAKKAYAMKETPIGAVVVYDGQIVGRGFNQVELTGDPTQHAEIVAIQDAAKTLGRWRLFDCHMYVTMEPCLMCAGAIENSRIKKLYIGASHKKNHLVGKHNDFKLEVYRDRNINVEFGILEEEASRILTDFFRERRKEKKI